MAEPLVLDAKRCAFILIDMTNAITKGQGPPYTTPPHRQALVQNFVRLVAHCRRVGTPVIYTTISRHPQHIDARKPSPMLDRPAARRCSPAPCVEIIEELRPHPNDFSS
jgi:nicotinamidase-related amidase